MNQGTENEVVAARLVRVPWWRAALSRLGVGKDRRYQETLERLARAEVTDTIGEADVKSWLAMMEGESKAVSQRSKDRPER